MILQHLGSKVFVLWPQCLPVVMSRSTMKGSCGTLNEGLEVANTQLDDIDLDEQIKVTGTAI